MEPRYGVEQLIWESSSPQGAVARWRQWRNEDWRRSIGTSVVIRNTRDCSGGETLYQLGRIDSTGPAPWDVHITWNAEDRSTGEGET